MKTQIRVGPGAVSELSAARKASKPSGQTKDDAIAPIASIAATGEQLRTPKQTSDLPAPKLNARLSIEKDETTGKYIYKTIDPETGEVVKQWPREDVLKAISDINNTAGMIVDQKV